MIYIIYEGTKHINIKHQGKETSTQLKNCNMTKTMAFLLESIPPPLSKWYLVS